jgi:5-methylcytosine-specific restriction enzyme A
MPWTTSARRQELPKNWPAIRRRILRRDGYQCRHLEQGTRCAETATDVDHITRGAGDHDTNLQSLCPDHHRAKTLHEAQTARRAMLAKAHHPTEPHPGRL